MEKTQSRMTKRVAPERWRRVASGVGACLMMTSGCHRPHQDHRVTVDNTWLGPVTIAVAPAINLSGSSDFDPNRLADIMASELSYAEGVSVVPVSRVLSTLAAQGWERVESPDHAWEIATLVGADAILVFAVTEYDPYDPPRVGITAQLYGREPWVVGPVVDPVVLSRKAGLDEAMGARRADRLLARAQRVFDAGQRGVEEEIKAFARQRGTGDSPFGWRRFVVSQLDYMRFCSHATIRTLLDARQNADRWESAAG